jgi:hypothetical protein
MIDVHRYVSEILQAYLQLPDTPKRIHRLDRKLAFELHQLNVPIQTVEAAMLLASLRRIRPPNTPPLPPIRSLHYFLPIIREINAAPLTKDYVDYLKRTAALKLR